VRFVHNDYTVKSGPRLLRDHLPPEEPAPGRAPPRRDQRLAPDPGAGSVPAPRGLRRALDSRRRLVPTDLVYPDRVGEVYSVRFNPAHHWYFYSGLGRDEVILIKTYDSPRAARRASARTARSTIPPAAGGAAAREHRARALVLFGGLTRLDCATYPHADKGEKPEEFQRCR
jgi:hypothetical protein